MDISRLPFDLDIIARIKTAEKLFEVFPVLRKYDVFLNDIPISLPRAFELIVMLYSTSMPQELMVERERAKSVVAEYFGYRVVDGVIMDETIKSLFSGQSDAFNSMIIAYCRLQKNAKFSKLVAWWDAYYANIAMLRDAANQTKEKQKDIIAVIEKLEKDIDLMVNEFLNHENNSALKSELIGQIEDISLGLRPEQIADKLENGEPVVDIAPYGKDYDFPLQGDRTRVNPYSED